MTLTVGSLFSGIGGLELGLERAGMKVKWQVEIDPYARKVLEKHWPNVRRYEDVREVGAHNLGPVDLICGGFPCQDISNAGKRVGIDGERSGLWGEYIRIVREVRPRFVLVENVAALLVRGLERVLGDLAASGFDAEWDCIPAAAVGAPHRRDRLFVVAYAQRHQRGLQPKSESQRSGASVFGIDGAEGAVANAAGLRRNEGGQASGSWGGGARPGWASDAFGGGPDVADPVRVGPQEQGDPGIPRGGGPANRTAIEGWWTAEPDVGRVAHGVSSRVDRLKCLGNAVVPQVAEFIGRRILEAA